MNLWHSDFWGHWGCLKVAHWPKTGNFIIIHHCFYKSYQKILIFSIKSVFWQNPYISSRVISANVNFFFGLFRTHPFTIYRLRKSVATYITNDLLWWWLLCICYIALPCLLSCARIHVTFICCWALALAIVQDGCWPLPRTRNKSFRVLQSKRCTHCLYMDLNCNERIIL